MSNTSSRVETLSDRHTDAEQVGPHLVIDKTEWVPGQHPDSNDIAYYDKSKVSAEQLEQDAQLEDELREKSAIKPSIGDVYLNLDNAGTAMVVAITNEEVTLGTGEKLTFHALYKADNWSYLYNINDGDFR